MVGTAARSTDGMANAPLPSLNTGPGWPGTPVSQSADQLCPASDETLPWIFNLKSNTITRVSVG